MNNFIELLQEPWPWYVGGPLIGLMIPLLLYFLNQSFGVSSTLKHACAMCVGPRIKFFDYDWKKEIWSVMFVLGICLGGFIVYLFIPTEGNIELSENTILKMQGLGITNFEGMVPLEIFSWQNLSNPIVLLFIVLGGFLVGFGTRYANGCTSGHAIMGMSMLSLGSFVATIGFFIGGLIVSWFVLPYLLLAL